MSPLPPVTRLLILDPSAVAENTPDGVVLTLTSLTPVCLQRVFSAMIESLRAEGLPTARAEKLAEEGVNAMEARLLGDAFAGILRRIG